MIHNPLNQNYLNFGDENFLFGNINVDVQAAVFKSSIMVMLDSNRFNHSNNSTYMEIRINPHI